MHFQNGASCLAQAVIRLLVTAAEIGHTDEGPSRALDTPFQLVPTVGLLPDFGKTLLSCKRPGCSMALAGTSRRP